jgi:hypothetical protein
VAKLCEQMQELARVALMVLRPGCSTSTVLFFSVEDLAGLAIDWVVVIQVGLVRAAIVQKRQR